MTAACMKELFDLHSGHAYTLVGAIELSNGQKLVKMRNPWGSEHYDGPWNDSDPAWTTELKKEAGLEVKDDGYFFMAIVDFKKVFKTLTVLMYKDRRGGDKWYVN